MNNKKYLFLTLALSLCCFIGTIQAEYLFLKKVGDSLELPTEEEHTNEVYPVIMQYQFPMCTNPLNGNPWEEYVKSEIDERTLLEDKLQKFDKNYKVIFVPTALYELFMIEKYTDRTLDLWADYIMRFFLDNCWRHKRINDEDMQKTFDLVISTMEEQLGKDEALLIIEKIKECIPTLRMLLEENKLGPDDYFLNPFFEEIYKKIYFPLLKKHLHVLSQMGDLYQEDRSIGKTRRPCWKMLITLIASISDDSLNIHAQEIHKRERVYLAHYTLNTELGKLMQPSTTGTTLSLSQSQTIATVLINKINDNVKTSSDLIKSTTDLEDNPDKNTSSFINLMVNKNQTTLETFNTPATTKIISSILENEYKAEAENSFNVYRSGYIHLKNDMPSSISFGNTLFAGFIGDNDIYSGACVFTLEKERQKHSPSQLMIVPVNKQQYYRDIKLGKNLMYIPPYNTIIEFAGGSGELFHTRTRALHVPRCGATAGLKGETYYSAPHLFTSRGAKINTLLEKLVLLFEPKANELIKEYIYDYACTIKKYLEPLIRMAESSEQPHLYIRLDQPVSNKPEKSVLKCRKSEVEEIRSPDSRATPATEECSESEKEAKETLKTKVNPIKKINEKTVPPTMTTNLIFKFWDYCKGLIK